MTCQSRVFCCYKALKLIRLTLPLSKERTLSGWTKCSELHGSIHHLVLRTLLSCFLGTGSCSERDEAASLQKGDKKQNYGLCLALFSHFYLPSLEQGGTGGEAGLRGRTGHGEEETTVSERAVRAGVHSVTTVLTSGCCSGETRQSGLSAHCPCLGFTATSLVPAGTGWDTSYQQWG